MVTIASAFEAEVCLHVELLNRRRKIPAIIDVDSLRRRYIVQAMHVEEDEEGKPRLIAFYDGSIAERDNTDRRIWREVHDGENQL